MSLHFRLRDGDLTYFSKVDYLHQDCKKKPMKTRLISAFLLLYLGLSLGLSLGFSHDVRAADLEEMSFEESPPPTHPSSGFFSSCWQSEGFPSELPYRIQISEWKRDAVPFPGPFDALTAYRVYKNEAAFALEHYKNDKKVHCYMGCRIAQDANFETAQWAGWEKERRDLEDCNPSTHFEVLDYTVTVTGAHLGLKSNRRDDCTRACDREF